MNKPDQPIRDFIYLDWERVRSLAAQVFRGVPESEKTQRSSEIETAGKVSGGLPGIVKGEAGADYRYFRSQSETRSFHHYVYSMVERRLQESGLLTEIGGDFDFDCWTTGFFRDGQFVKVQGLLRLMDYGWIAEMVDALPKLNQVAQSAQNRSLAQLKAAGLLTQKQFDEQKRSQQGQSKELASLKVGEITALLRQLYGDVVRVKVLPNKTHPHKLFFGTGLPSAFNDSPAALSQRYGYEIDAGWVTFGQVNISVVSDDALAMPVGHQMEDSMEQMAIAMGGIMRIASSVQFPAVSITPISIYRDCC